MGCVDTTPGPDPGEGDPDPAGGAATVGPDDTHGADAPLLSGAATDDPTGGGGPDDTVDGDDGDGHEALRFQQWMKRSATGAVLSGIALGLQQIFEPKRELPAFVMEAPDAPHDPDAPFTLHFDPDDPTKTVAVIRTPTADTPDADPHREGPDHRTRP